MPARCASSSWDMASSLRFRILRIAAVSATTREGLFSP